MIAAAVSIFILEGTSVAVSPVQYKDTTSYFRADTQAPIFTYTYKNFPAILSELIGTFMFVFLFMLCTDKKTQFSEDKVINCFIMASAYVAARLLAGGTMVTCRYTAYDKETLPEYITIATNSTEDPTFKMRNARLNERRLGPLLNPALALGQMVLSADLNFFLQYLIMPFAGSVIALVFYELVFVKSQEYLNAEEEPEEEEGTSLKDGIDQSPPSKQRLIHNVDIEEDNTED